LAARQLEEPVIMKHLYLPAAAALALAACASNSTSDMAATGSPSEASAVQPMSAMDYVAAAGESDLFEIQSSQIALRKAQNADVRAFAQMMIDHHTQTSADLMAAARQAGLNPPAPSLSQEKSARVGALESTPATGFDALYMREQVTGHQAALALHQGYARNGDQPGLKAAAVKTAPIVQTHLDRARALAGRS
jgi:putative membrane protein